MKLNFLSVALLALVGAQLGAYAAESPAGGFKRSHQEKYLIYYTGTATLTGRFVRRLDKETLEKQGDMLCFFPKGASASFVPRPKGDPRLAWFCFSNQRKAKTLLKANDTKPKGSCGMQGEATVVVSNYVVNSQEAEVFDTARLVKVIKSPGSRALSCKK
jgi:hypothetical protein